MPTERQPDRIRPLAGSAADLGAFPSLTPAQWRERLTRSEYHILREAGTDAPWSHPYTDLDRPGTYACRGCGTPLFRSDAKFAAHCGWPAFFEPVGGDRITYRVDRTLGRVRTEIRCTTCDGHLGHVFDGEGYDTPTDRRYCVNGTSLVFTPDDTTVTD